MIVGSSVVWRILYETSSKSPMDRQDPEDDGTQVLRRGNLRSDAEWTRHVLGLLCVCWSDDDAWQMKERQK